MIKKPEWPFPAYKIDSSFIAGMREMGHSPILLGTFGGFGGSWHWVCYDEQEALEKIEEYRKKDVYYSAAYLKLETVKYKDLLKKVSENDD